MRVFLVLVLTTSLATGAWLAWSALPRGPDPAAPPSAMEEFAGLDESRQQWIWDLEHWTFELETKFGKPFAAAWAERAPDWIDAFLVREAFQADVPDPRERRTLDRSVWQSAAWTRTDAASTQRGADAAALAAHLRGYLAEFERVAATSFRVLSIRPYGRPPGSGRPDVPPTEWALRVLLAARGFRADGQPIECTTVHSVACRFQVDADIESRQIISRWRVDEEHLTAAPKMMFEDGTEAAGLAGLELRDNWLPLWAERPPFLQQYNAQLACDDFDRDGLLDLALSNLDGRQYLLRGLEGGRFDDRTATLGIPPQRQNAAVTFATWFDYDNDGYPDLLLGQNLYHNDEGTRFRDVTAGSGLRFTEETMGAVPGDFDLDGRLDLYLLNHRSSMMTDEKIGYVDDDKSGAENQLWRNLGGGRFVDVTAGAGVGGGKRHSFAAAWLYANGDRWPDLYVANDFGTNQLYLNQGNGRFVDVAPRTGVGDFATSMGVATGDLDNDGGVEIYVANMYSKMGRRIIEHVTAADYPPGIFEQIQGSCAGNRLYRPLRGGEEYEELSETLGINEVGWAYAPALADFDGDGLLDIYATCGFLSFDRSKPDG